MRQAREEHEQRAQNDCKALAKSLIEQWPCEIPVLSSVGNGLLIDVVSAYNAVLPEYQRMYHNHEFCLHLARMQDILTQRYSIAQLHIPASISAISTLSKPPANYALPRLNDLMGVATGHALIHSSLLNKANIGKARAITRSGPQKRLHGSPAKIAPKDASRELRQVIEPLLYSNSGIQRRYASQLQQSIDAYERHISAGQSSIQNGSWLVNGIHSNPEIQRNVEDRFNRISYSLAQVTALTSQNQVQWLQGGNLWPVVTPVTILEQLRSTLNTKFGSGMKEAIIQFALAITEFQQHDRIKYYQHSHEMARLEEERNNTGHSNWHPSEYQDWLLLEIESNLLIRKTQVEVASEIIAPRSGECSVLQLNMGQGKTSCIIPMVACLLADGKSLVRVSVPKALLQQTAELLHSCLGGLIGREISHVPFSRRTSTKEESVKLFHRLHRDVQKKRGVMLTLPEHQLSFMLSGVQRVLDNQIPEADMMIRVQNWIQSHSRDILDESDHTLAVKTQLIYPSGSQMAVDGHPHRWLVAEQILNLVDMHLHNLAHDYPHSIEVVRRPQGGFPFAFFLRQDVEEELVNRLRYDVCQGARGIIPMESLNVADRVAVKDFLSAGNIRPSSIDRVRSLCPDRPHLRQIVYLLRGFFVHRILIMTLKKRYGVQYGLHPSRDPVAVPFHAKGVPSEQSEFGHVDVSESVPATARNVFSPSATRAV